MNITDETSKDKSMDCKSADLKSRKRLNRLNRIMRRVRVAGKILKKKQGPQVLKAPSVGPLMSLRDMLRGISRKKTKQRIVSSQTGRTGVSMGIYIGHKDLLLVKIINPDKNTKNTPPLIENRKFPLPLDAMESKEFAGFLQTALASFGASQKITQTWVVMSSGYCDMHFIRIPKVSPRLLETTISWHLQKDAAFNKETSFFDYELRGDSGEADDKKMDIMCCISPLAEVEKIKTLFAGINIPLSGISPVQFAVQNVFLQHMRTPQEKHTACLFLSTDHSRIDIYNHGKLILTRNIKTGIDSMISALVETLKTNPGVELTPVVDREVLFELDMNNIPNSDASAPAIGLAGAEFNYAAAQEVLFTLSEDTASIILPNGNVIAREKVIEIIIPSLERLVRQIDRTLEHFVLTLDGNRNIKNFYISGVMPIFNEMITYFSSQLGSKCRLFDPIKPKAKALSYEDRNSFLPAYGIALSDNAYTPNLIYTYKEKIKTAYTVKINQLILAGLIITVLICAGVFAVQKYETAKKTTVLAKLEKEIKNTRQLINKDAISRLMAASGQKQRKYSDISNRYSGIAVIAELARLTPRKSITLSSLNMDFVKPQSGLPLPTPAVTTPPTAASAAPPAQTGAGVATTINPAASINKSGNFMVIEGEINGKQDNLEMLFAGYIMDLKASPLFSDVTVLSSTMETVKNHHSLTFVINLKIGK